MDADTQKSRHMALMTVFAMTLVVAGHCDITSDYKETWVFRWIYSFHMPLFFFISGFLFALTNPPERIIPKGAYSSFIKKKSLRLLGPFLFINSIIFIIKAAFIKDTSLMQHPLKLSIPSFIETTFLYPTGFMWFLPALFVVFIIAFPFYKYLKTSRIAIGGGKLLIFTVLAITAIGIIGTFLPPIAFMQISQAIYYLTYFLTGILYCEFKPVIDRFIKKYWIGITLLFFALSASLILKGYLAAFAGIIFSTSFALILEEKCSDKVVKLASLCYTVFLLSYFPQMIIRGPIAHLFTDINQYWLSALSFVAGWLIPVAFGLIFLKLKKRHLLAEKSAILFGL